MSPTLFQSHPFSIHCSFCVFTSTNSICVVKLFVRHLPKNIFIASIVDPLRLSYEFMSQSYQNKTKCDTLHEFCQVIAFPIFPTTVQISNETEIFVQVPCQCDWNKKLISFAVLQHAACIQCIPFFCVARSSCYRFCIKCWFSSSKCSVPSSVKYELLCAQRFNWIWLTSRQRSFTKVHTFGGLWKFERFCIDNTNLHEIELLPLVINKRTRYQWNASKSINLLKSWNQVQMIWFICFNFI